MTDLFVNKNPNNSSVSNVGLIGVYEDINASKKYMCVYGYSGNFGTSSQLFIDCYFDEGCSTALKEVANELSNCVGLTSFNDTFTVVTTEFTKLTNNQTRADVDLLFGPDARRNRST